MPSRITRSIGEGSFGFVDSFVQIFRVTLSSGTGEASRALSINVSAHGVVTPKALAFEEGALRVAGYGTSDLVTLSLEDGRELARAAMPPGARTLTAFSGMTVVANPLLDAWVVVEGSGGARVVSVEPGSTPPLASRLGEALIFTTLIAPWNKHQGRLSRFTCETCHFEGTVDGRVHHTGRGDVRATTKPILGLLNNGPHFSRALDPDLTTLSMNEFRVANANSDHDPLFAVAPATAPWLVHLGAGAEATHSPEDLRRAFIQFLAEFSHRPNARALRTAGAQRGFSTEERRCAGLFRDRCESCHAAKLAADAEARVPFAEWEKLVLSAEAPLVFGDARYEKTGIEPTVHERGARVPSLRRSFLKRPYFTNGSAADLEAVLEGVRIDQGRFLHAGGPSSGAPLAKGEHAPRRAFLELL